MSTYYISLHSINYVVQVLISKWNPLSMFRGSYHQEIKCISYHRRDIQEELRDVVSCSSNVLEKQTNKETKYI